jgi:hypothetical protein
MGRRECVRGVLEDAGSRTDDEIDEVLADLEAKRRRRQARGRGTDEARATQKDADAVAEDLELAAKIERRNAKLNQVVYRQLMDDIGNFGDDAAGIEAMLAGSNRRVEGARLSVDALTRSYESKYFGGLVHDLRKANLLQYVQARFMGFGKGLLDDKIARELWELREGGTPGSSGSKEAREIATIINKYQELARQDQNAHGAFIRRIDGYIVSQSHDMFRIDRAGKEKWIQDVKPLLSERMFGDVQLTGDEAVDTRSIDEFLGFIYDELRTGNFLKADNEAPLIGFKGPANLAKKASAARVLHFKDSDAFVKYNDAYGTGSLMEAVASGLRRAANTTALLERLGTNPGAMFERVLSDLRERSRNAPDNVRTRLMSSFPERLMSVVDGSIDIPSNVTIAQRSAAARALQVQSSLGGAVLASFPDVATAASELQFQGRNFLGALGEQLGGMLAQVAGSRAQREAADLVGVGIDSILRDVASRVTVADNAGSTINKLNTAFFKLNLLSQWTTAGERAVSEIMSATLGRLRADGFDRLPPRLRQVLELYNVTSSDWDLIRFNAMEEFEGRVYVSPEKLREGGIDERQARAVEAKIRAYFSDRSAVAVLQGGSREKLYVTQAAQAGTGMGEAIRFIMQFKSYGISFVQKVIGRYTQEDRFWSIPGSVFKMPASEAAQMGQLIVTLTGLGYLSMAAKDIAKGREPRDPMRLDTMQAAMLQGGGFGIYADFLLARTNRFGGGFFDTAMGPLFGDVSAAGDLWSKTRDYATGQSDDAPDVEAFNFVKGNTPFINLFYTRAAVDYLILYHIQEALNPGSLRRMEQRLKKEQGQEFILPPSEVVN